MGCVICCRCDKMIDLDFNVEDAVVMPDGISWCCVGCSDEEEE